MTSDGVAVTGRRIQIVRENDVKTTSGLGGQLFSSLGQNAVGEMEISLKAEVSGTTVFVGCHCKCTLLVFHPAPQVTRPAHWLLTVPTIPDRQPVADIRQYGRSEYFWAPASLLRQQKNVSLLRNSQTFVSVSVSMLRAPAK